MELVIFCFFLFSQQFSWQWLWTNMARHWSKAATQNFIASLLQAIDEKLAGSLGQELTPWCLSLRSRAPYTGETPHQTSSSLKSCSQLHLGAHNYILIPTLRFSTQARPHATNPSLSSKISFLACSTTNLSAFSVASHSWVEEKGNRLQLTFWLNAPVIFSSLQS